MHEASIAQAVLEKVFEVAAENGGGKIKLVKMRVGPLANVMEDALRFAFSALAKGTCAEESNLEIDINPLSANCMDCGWSGECGRREIRCGGCGGENLELPGSREICLATIKLQID